MGTNLVFIFLKLKNWKFGVCKNYKICSNNSFCINHIIVTASNFFNTIMWLSCLKFSGSQHIFWSCSGSLFCFYGSLLPSIPQMVFSSSLSAINCFILYLYSFLAGILLMFMMGFMLGDMVGQSITSKMCDFR